MAGKLSRNFDWKEFTKSDTATRLHIINEVTTWEVRDNIKALVDNILQPLRDAWGQPLFINSGYRCLKLNAAVGGVPTSQHCFDEDTEILTTRGWLKHDEIRNDDMVFSYNIASDKIESTPIEKVIKYHYKGEMLGILNKQIDVLTTDKHRMLVRYEPHKYVRKNTLNISPDGQKYFDSLKTDNDLWHIENANEVYGKRRIYKSAGRSVAWNVANIPFFKMCMAVIADGYFCHKQGANGVGVGFRFKKERKCAQLELLLNELGWYFTKKLDKNGVWNYYLRHEYGKKIHSIIGEKKLIPYEVLSFGAEALRELVLYYALYDGCNDKRENCNSVSICTTIKHNADMLQAMSTLSNMRCVCTKKERGTYNIKGASGVGKDYFVLSVNRERNDSKAHEERYYKKNYDGIVWCVNNRNTTLVIRRNGKVSIQGNCLGMAADVGCSNPYELAKLAIKLKLDFDQLIVYDTFVHFSYDKDGRNRGQILYNKRYKGAKDL